MGIKVERANKFIAQIMLSVRDSLSVSSDKQQAIAMGLGQATVNKLLNPNPSQRNIPDARTLEAIATYRHQKLWELIKEIEEECLKEITEAENKRAAIAAGYRLENKDSAIEVVTAIANHLNHLHQRDKLSSRE